jgi:hypothetical protein
MRNLVPTLTTELQSAETSNLLVLGSICTVEEQSIWCKVSCNCKGFSINIMPNQGNLHLMKLAVECINPWMSIQISNLSGLGCFAFQAKIVSTSREEYLLAVSTPFRADLVIRSRRSWFRYCSPFSERWARAWTESTPRNKTRAPPNTGGKWETFDGVRSPSNSVRSNLCSCENTA